MWDPSSAPLLLLCLSPTSGDHITPTSGSPFHHGWVSTEPIQAPTKSLPSFRQSRPAPYDATASLSPLIHSTQSCHDLPSLAYIGVATRAPSTTPLLHLCPIRDGPSTATAHCFHLAPRRAPYPAPANSASTATAMADPGLSSRSPSINSHHPHSFLPRPRRSIPRLLHHSLQEIYGRNASRHAHRSSIAACTSILIGHHHRLLPAPKNSTREFSVASSTPSTTHHRASATGAPLLPPSMRPPLSGTLFCPGAQKQRRVLLPHRLISNV